MSKIIFLIKIFINILLYVFYSIISVIIGNFLYGAYLTFILEVSVPGSSDFSHIKIAIFSLIFILFFTFIFRSFFYLSLKKNKGN